MEDIYTRWIITICRVWWVPWRTHNNMLPHLAGIIDPELWFVKRCIKFISICMKSDNNTVTIISMIGVNGLYSGLGANYKVPSTKYGMHLNNIMKVWNERCANEEDIIRKCEQVRELCEVRDRCVTLILNKEESYTIIEFLCTYYIFTYGLKKNLKCAI